MLLKICEAHWMVVVKLPLTARTSAVMANFVKVSKLLISSISFRVTQ